MSTIDTLKLNEQIWDTYSCKHEYDNDCYNSRYTRGDMVEPINPIVSDYLYDNGFRITYPGNKKFTLCLTHDIDDIYPPLFHTMNDIYHSLKNIDLNKLNKNIFWRFKGKHCSPYWNFKEIMEIEKKYDGVSTFYFLTSNKDPKRFRYNIEDLDIELGHIVDNGCEVGLHGGYYSFQDFNMIRQEKNRLERCLGRNIIGYRNHYLRFKVPDTWKILKEVGFKYDSTFGYNNAIGFRNGMCYPFKPFDIIENKEIDLIEIPMAIMDVTLFNSTDSFGDLWTKSKNLIDGVSKINGVLTLLWHNNVFYSYNKLNWVKLYNKILEYCYENNAWITSGENVYDWWKTRL